MSTTPESLDPAAVVTHLGDEPHEHLGAAAPPIFQTSLFVQPDLDSLVQPAAGSTRPYLYTRTQNPTVELFERKLAALEGAGAARAFASGMAAIAAAVLSCVRAGGHVITIETVYGPARRLFAEYLPRFGVETTFVDGRDPEDFARALRPHTRLIYLETPSTGVFHLQDIAAVAELARPRGIPVVVDNSWATPIFQNPLRLGADLVVHSASKYLGGHSDVLAGVVAGDAGRIARLADEEGALLGAVLSPFDAWLLVRGMRTLPLRMAAVMERGLELARFLASHPRVARVHHPWLPEHPQHALARRQMRGASGLFSFEPATRDPEDLRRFLGALRWFRLGVSWGGHESLVVIPGAVRSGSLPPPPWTVRLSVGLEPVEALKEDLDRALAAMRG